MRRVENEFLAILGQLRTPDSATISSAERKDDAVSRFRRFRKPARAGRLERVDWRFMPCKHLKELYDKCQEHNLRLSSSDLIRIVCPQCGVEEVCPSLLCDEYEEKHHEEAEPPTAN